MPGWVGSDRRERLPADWPKRRNRVLRRDGHRCTHRDDDGKRCEELATDVDHVRPGDDHAETNLTSLCAWHHQRKSGREGGQARAAAKRRTDRRFQRSEAHPGLVRA